MTWPYFQTIINLLGALVLPLLFFVWRETRKVRDNDLKHIQDGIDRVEKKLDEHISYHLERGL